MFPVIYSRPRLDSENGDRETRTLATSMQQRCNGQTILCPLFTTIYYIYIRTYIHIYVHTYTSYRYVYIFIYI